MKRVAWCMCVIIFTALFACEAFAVGWETKADIPYHVYGHGGGVVKGKLYAIGGCETADWTKTSTKVQAYDVATDSWGSASDLPVELGWPMVAVYKDKIYVFGGMRNGAVSTEKAWVYDTASNSWSGVGNLPDKIMNGIAIAEGDFIYVGLGYERRDETPEGVVENFLSFYRYDPAKDTYTRLADAPEGACYAGVGAYADSLYVVHGAVFETGFHDMKDYGWTDGALRYNVSENTWEKLNSPRIQTRVFFLTQCTSSAAYQEKLFVCGGQSHYQRTTTASYFDMKRERFFELPALSKPRCCGGGGAGVVGGLLILSGGFWGVGETGDPAKPTWVLDTSELYEPGYVVTNSIGMKLGYVPAGRFTMGSAGSEPMHQYDEQEHPVRISKPFYISVTEVTQKQWQEVMGHNPSHQKGDDLPVEKVSWVSAVEFCKKLSAKEAKNYRLPTEAQWEYACLADDGGTFSGTGDIDDMAWYEGNSKGKSHEVGTKRPNSWGLYDMHGNVAEWCGDYYLAEYPKEEVIDPAGPGESKQRVVRGGSWSHFPIACRSAARSSSPASYQFIHTGLRAVMEVPE